MRYLGYAANGAPWDALHLQEGAEPILCDGMVLVALEAAPVHIADLKAIRGELPFVPAGPGVPGFEGVGRIVRCAADVQQWRDGDRVILPMAYGAWQERLAVSADALWRAPDGVAAEQLALVRINLSTAYLLLHAYTALQPGDWIVQNAANSNVAHYVARLAAGRGVQVIDVVRRPEAADALRGAGRTHVLLDGDDLAERIAGLTDRRPCLALDAIGGAATARLGRVVADGGLVLAYGFLAEQAYAIDYPDMMFRDVRLRSMMTDRALARIGDDGRAQMRAAIEALIASEPLDAPIAGVYGFDEAAAALRHAAAIGDGRAGKVILVPRRPQPTLG